MDLAKIEAIRDLSPTTLRQLHPLGFDSNQGNMPLGLLGKVNYIRRFIPNLSFKNIPMIISLKKESRFKWNEDCQNAFEEL